MQAPAALDLKDSANLTRLSPPKPKNAFKSERQAGKMRMYDNGF